MSNDGGERLFPASPRRRQQAREEGRVVRSRELTSACLLLGTAGFSGWCGTESMRTAALWLRGELTTLSPLNTPTSMLVDQVSSAAMAGLSLCLGIFAVGFTVTLATGLLQTGFVWSSVPITPNFGRLLPAAGWSRFAEGLQPGAMGVALLKLLLPGLCIGWVLMSQWESFGKYLDASPPEIFQQTQSLATSTGWRLGLVTIAIGLTHFAHRFWRMEVELRMTREEMQDEQKQSPSSRRPTAPSPLRGSRL